MSLSLSVVARQPGRVDRTIVSFLTGLPLFEGRPLHTVVSLADRMEVRRVRRGDVVHDGDAVGQGEHVAGKGQRLTARDHARERWLTTP